MGTIGLSGSNRLDTIGQAIFSHLTTLIPSSYATLMLDAATRSRPRMALTRHQVLVLQHAVDSLRQFFYAGGSGLKRTYMENSSEYRSLKNAFSLYLQQTDRIIRAFGATQKTQG